MLVSGTEGETTDVEVQVSYDREDVTWQTGHASHEF